MKTYCISDVHGHLDNLMRFVETLEKEDRVYVLGDVVDKGPNSIECLQYIMYDSRFTMLLGNHEYMMFNVLSLEDYAYGYSEEYEMWIDYNEGEKTLVEYNSLSRAEQLEIYNYIKKLPLNIPDVKVGDKIYYLVHSCPHSDLKLTMEAVDYSDLKINSYVWDRVDPLDNDVCVEGKIVIAGHTPVQAYIGLSAKEVLPLYDRKKVTGISKYDLNDANYIDIDGGLAARLENSRLIALCLDDCSYKLY